MKSKKSTAWQNANRAVRDGAQQLYVDILHQLAREHTSDGSPYASLPGFLRGRDYKGLLNWADSLLEQTYSSATEHFVANQFASLIRKYPWDPTVVGTDPEGTAIKTFLRSERKCALLNRKFRLYRTLRTPSKYWEWYGSMRVFIKYVLGERPNFQRIYDGCDFGSGASVGVHGNATNLYRKITREVWSCSPGASPYAFVALRTNPLLRELLSQSKGEYWCDDRDAQWAKYAGKRSLVNYNMVTFVPKTAKTDRAIAVEPLLNGFVQKGIDTEMRLLLKRIRIDLSDQTRNQEMARQGSLSDSADSFITIDLSSASDSISTELCRNLLPEAWFDLLNHTRSQSFKLGEEIKPYSKFCSMGNGFCFPLETLLFTAACHAAGAGTPGTDFSVYGDDIIVRKKYAGTVLAILKEMGFSPNSKKTLVEGPFRESCGGDFYNGVNVRPYTLKERLENIPALFKFLNLTRRSPLTENFFAGVRNIVMKRIPLRYLFVRPFVGTPDTGVDSTGDEHLRFPNSRWNNKRFVWEWKELCFHAVRDKTELTGRDQCLAGVYALLRGSPSGDRGEVEFTVRRKTRTTIVRKSGGGPGTTWTPVQR